MVFVAGPTLPQSSDGRRQAEWAKGSVRVGGNHTACLGLTTNNLLHFKTGVVVVVVVVVVVGSLNNIHSATPFKIASFRLLCRQCATSLKSLRSQHLRGRQCIVWSPRSGRRGFAWCCQLHLLRS